MTPDEITALVEARVQEELAKRAEAEVLPAKLQEDKALKDAALRSLSAAALQESRWEQQFKSGQLDRTNSFERAESVRGAAADITREIEVELGFTLGA